MNTIKPNTPDEIIALMQAYKEGKKIVIHSICPILGGAPGWRFIESGKWDFTNYRYEVARELASVWGIVSPSGELVAVNLRNKPQLSPDFYSPHYRVILMREVIE